MKKLWAGCSVFVIVFALAAGAWGQESWKMKHSLSPGILTGEWDWTVAVDYDVVLSKAIITQGKQNTFGKNLNVRIASEGTLAADSDLNTRPLTVDARITSAVNYYKAPRIVLGDRPGEYKKVSEGYDYGRLDFSAMAGYETDQDLDHRNFTMGAEVGYVQTEHNKLKALIPSVFLGWDWVIVDNSEIQEDLGVDDEISSRYRAFLAWKLPIGQWLSESLDPLNLHIDLRYFKSHGLPDQLKSADQDEATYLAGAFSYSFENRPLWGVVNAAFVRIADGRQPPNTEDETTITFGVTLWER